MYHMKSREARPELAWVPGPVSGAGHGMHAVSQLLERGDRQLPDRLIVFHHEDRLGSLGNGRGGSGQPAFGGPVAPREARFEARAPPRLAGDEDVAEALADDAVDGRQAEARSLPRGLPLGLRRQTSAGTEARALSLSPAGPGNNGARTDSPAPALGAPGEKEVEAA